MNNLSTLEKDIVNKLDGIDWAVRYIRKAFRNRDSARMRLAIHSIKNVCDWLLEKIDLLEW